MTYPAFLDNQQVEELEAFGTLELTDELLEALMSWCYGDEPIVTPC